MVGDVKSDMVLEKVAGSGVLHPDPQVAGREHDTGPGLDFWKPQSPPPETHFFQQGHTSKFFQIVPLPGDQATNSRASGDHSHSNIIIILITTSILVTISIFFTECIDTLPCQIPNSQCDLKNYELNPVTPPRPLEGLPATEE